MERKRTREAGCSRETMERLVSLAARLLLECGAETYRVEETVCFIARRLGARDAQVLSLPTGCLYTLVDAEGETFSRVVRVYARSTNLSTIEQVNDISRGLVDGRFDEGEALAKLETLCAVPPQPLWAGIGASVLGASGFAVLFQGGWYEALVAAVCGGLASLLSRAFGPALLPSCFHLFLSGALSAALARISALLRPEAGVSAIIVGAIMPLLPGMLITNAIRDTVSGDLLSGVARSAEALIRSAAIAAGVGVALALWRV